MDAKGKKMVKVVKKEASDFMVSDYDTEYEEDYMQDDDNNNNNNNNNNNDNSNKKKKGIVWDKESSGGGGGASGLRNCQVEKCMVDLTDAKPYHKRHRVCEAHAKARVVFMGGVRQRFCQQCSRFHELSEFDETKRSCRRRLAGHNERRRKKAAESNGEGTIHRGTGTQVKDIVCGQVDNNGRIKISIQENGVCKHFQIR